MQRTRTLLTPPVLLLLAAGCSGGGIDAPAGNPADSVSSGPSGTSGSSVGGASGATTTASGSPTTTTTGGVPEQPPPKQPEVETSCPTTTVSHTPLRRLTRFEYQNSVRDLLNVDVTAVNGFPADNATEGYNNNSRLQSVSVPLAEQYVYVSETLASLAVQNLPGLTTCDPATTGEEACAAEFARSFGRRAFRRALTAEDEQMFMNAYALGRTDGSYAEGLEVMIRAALQSPHFLYRLEVTPASDPAAGLVPLGAYEVATRLSYLIWASGPDDGLLDAAANGELATPEQVGAKAREMLASPKALTALNDFLSQWSDLDKLPLTSKNATLFPIYSADVNAAMRGELPALLNHMLGSGDHSLRTLLTTNLAFVNAPLAAVYGVPAPAAGATELVQVTLPEEQSRSGLLTQAGFLSVMSHPDQTSPVLRGKFVRTMLLCDPPDPPPDNVDISIPEVDSAATARDRFSAHLGAGAGCAGCHAKMDPIGLTLENFDAVGQFRTTENGQTIDVSGEILQLDEAALQGEFVGARALGEKLANSELVRDCVATQLFRYAAGRLEGLTDACSIATLQDGFTAADGDLVELLVSMTQTDAFLYKGQVTQ
ncbi:MAG TPA: DUF1592 domain-containing protein [Polyangiaceae bacterium]